MRRGTAYQSLDDDLRNEQPPRAYLSPGEGLHILRLDGRWLWIRRDVQVAQAVFEKISLSQPGRSPARLQAFCRPRSTPAPRARPTRSRSTSPTRSTVATGCARASARAAAGVGGAGKAGQGEALLADLERFFDSRERYAQLGIPWRRGYLLYGPPGTGKTLLVTALASELHLNVCTLSLASPIVTDEKIHTLLASVPQRSLLIEDVDAFFRERDAAHAQVKLSFSGFLNALDGVATQESTVLFMTTNHVERLDPQSFAPAASTSGWNWAMWTKSSCGGCTASSTTTRRRRKPRARRRAEPGAGGGAGRVDAAVRGHAPVSPCQCAVVVHTPFNAVR